MSRRTVSFGGVFRLFLLGAVAGLATACTDSSSQLLQPEAVTDDLPVAASHTPATSGTNTVDLLASQDIDVGDVTVTDDGTDLTVTFTMEGDWCLLETHVHAGDEEDDIPQAGRGNPVPGQFEASSEDLGCVASHSETVSLPSSSDADVIVAAHAVVVDQSDEQTQTIASAAGHTLFGPRDDYATPAAGDWGSALSAAEVTSPHSAWDWTQSSGVWISKNADALLDQQDVDQWLLFSSTLTLPDEAFDPTLTLHLNADNAVEFFIDGSSMFEKGTPDDVDDGADGPDRGSHASTAGPLTFDLQPGDNPLDWVVRNYFPTSTGSDNPVALIYAGTASYLMPETAWGEGTRFTERGSWGTYITYEPNTCPTVTGASSDLVALSGSSYPTDVTQGGQTSERIQYFAEGVTTSHSGIPLNIKADNSFEDNETADIEADAPVCSYYVHFDDGDLNDGDQWNDQFLSFDAEAQGAITAGTTNSSDPFSSFDTLCDTDDPLGAADVTYPGDSPTTCGSEGDARGLEIVPNQDRVEFSADKKTVEFDMQIGPKHDSFRILLNPVGSIVSGS